MYSLRYIHVNGALEDLSAYSDKSFDLVNTYPNQERVIGEMIKIADKKIMLSVSLSLAIFHIWQTQDRKISLA